MKKNDKLKNYSIIFIVIVLISSIIFLGVKESILPEETVYLTWDGINVTSTSAFGDFTNDRSRPFCGSNDGDVSFRNDISVDNSNLIIFSDIITQKRGCTEGRPVQVSKNEIKTSFTLPKGVLSVSCEVSGSDDDFGVARGFCKLIADGDTILSKSATASKVQLTEADIKAGLDKVSKGTIFGENTYDIIIAKESKIKIIQSTNTADSASTSSSSSRVQLAFKEIETIEEIEKIIEDKIIEDKIIEENDTETIIVGLNDSEVKIIKGLIDTISDNGEVIKSSVKESKSLLFYSIPLIIFVLIVLIIFYNLKRRKPKRRKR